jgi:hypothetical protein
MSLSTNHWRCPCEVICSCKPYDEDIEYHTICCGATGTLFDLETREGVDCPSELPLAEFSESRKTGGLLLYWTKTIYHMGFYVSSPSF